MLFPVNGVIIPAFLRKKKLYSQEVAELKYVLRKYSICKHIIYQLIWWRNLRWNGNVRAVHEEYYFPMHRWQFVNSTIYNFRDVILHSANSKFVTIIILVHSIKPLILDEKLFSVSHVFDWISTIVRVIISKILLTLIGGYNEVVLETWNEIHNYHKSLQRQIKKVIVMKTWIGI